MTPGEDFLTELAVTASAPASGLVAPPGSRALGRQHLSRSLQQPEGKGQLCLAFALQSLAWGPSSV